MVLQNKEGEPIIMGADTAPVTLDREVWGLICDAIEIAISKKVMKVNPRFAHMENIMEEAVLEIEKQSGCQTKKD